MKEDPGSRLISVPFSMMISALPGRPVSTRAPAASVMPSWAAFFLPSLTTQTAPDAEPTRIAAAGWAGAADAQAAVRAVRKIKVRQE